MLPTYQQEFYQGRDACLPRYVLMQLLSPFLCDTNIQRRVLFVVSGMVQAD